MHLRDDTERLLRAWDAYERTRGAPPIIDFDCAPDDEPVTAVTSRLAVAEQLQALLVQAERADDPRLAGRIVAHLTYVRALLGERLALTDYVLATQGCPATGWSEDYIEARGAVARTHLDALGIAWGPDTGTDLIEVEGPVDLESACDVMRATVIELEPTVRMLADTDAPYDLTVATADEDAYWAYWLDGCGPNVRLRLNLRRATFTKVLSRQFSLHEVLGHGLQSASYARQCATRDVPWVRLLSVHTPQQIMLEGLAQALPLFIAPDDQALLARVRLVHYTQLVRAELHLAVNAGVPAVECARRARERVPLWSDETISDLLTDRSTNPMLRSYLWAYPAGVDWFVRLAEDGSPQDQQRIFRAAYRDPLTSQDLQRHWPAGPSTGGE